MNLSGVAGYRVQHRVDRRRATTGKARRFHTVCEARTELIAPASDRFVVADNLALEQPLFDITQVGLKPEYQRTTQLMSPAGKR